MQHDAASSGNTDVAGEGFAAPAVPEDEKKNTTELEIAAGGLFASGNSKNLAATSSGKFKLRREANQFTSAAAVNYARAAPDNDSPMETTVENYQGKVRYDRFLGAGVAAFLSVTGRRDRFQGLDLRLNVDPGIAYYFIDEKGHQLWSELGYDLQYDVRRDENLAEARANGEDQDKTEVRHHGRAFVGYDNSLNDKVSFNTGVEYLQGIVETENWRLNWDIGLTSTVSESFSIATTFMLKYDNNPLAGVETTDTMTAINLVYSLK